MSTASAIDDREYEAQVQQVPFQKRALVMSILNQVRAGVAINSLQLPLALIENRSLEEWYSDFFISHLDVILHAHEFPTPEGRLLQVLKFYLSGWHGLVNEVRHPFNPILGEVFRCTYNCEDSTTEFLAEQISHHPPCTAFCLLNRQKQLALNANISPSFHLSLKGNRVETKLTGLMTGYLLSLKEEYVTTLPDVVIKGVILGELSMDLAGESTISCQQTGLKAKIKFQAGGSFIRKGSSHSVRAKIYREGHPKPIYLVEGTWKDVLTITDCQTDMKSEFFNARSNCKIFKSVPPLEKQAENESQRVWGQVMAFINQNNEAAAQEAKSALENAQRAIRRTVPFVPKYFIPRTSNDYIHSELAEALK